MKFVPVPLAWIHYAKLEPALDDVADAPWRDDRFATAASDARRGASFEADVLLPAVASALLAKSLLSRTLMSVQRSGPLGSCEARTCALARRRNLPRGTRFLRSCLQWLLPAAFATTVSNRCDVDFGLILCSRDAVVACSISISFIRAVRPRCSCSSCSNSSRTVRLTAESLWLPAATAAPALVTHTHFPAAAKAAAAACFPSNSVTSSSEYAGGCGVLLCLDLACVFEWPLREYRYLRPERTDGAAVGG